MLGYGYKASRGIEKLRIYRNESNLGYGGNQKKGYAYAIEKGYDFVAFVRHLLEEVYATAGRVHLVLDNLNTHFRECFEDVLGTKKARALVRRAVFNYTSKHASWLNMAEIEIGIMDRQCLDRRLPNRAAPVAEVNAWQLRRNTNRRGIAWSFTRQDADDKMIRHYVAQLIGRDTRGGFSGKAV